MSETRIIKKYPNRRLYDTKLSCYITLDDVKILVQDQVPIQIIEARTKKDITHMTLIYLMVEQENTEAPLFNPTLLEQFIRLYKACEKTHPNSDAVYELVTHTLANTISFLSEQVPLLHVKTQAQEEGGAAQKAAPLILHHMKINAKHLRIKQD